METDRTKIPETVVNRAAILLIRDWNEMEKKNNYKIHKLRKRILALGAAVSGTAVETVDSSGLIVKPS